MKLKVKPEGRKDMWTVKSKKNLIAFIKSRKLKQIHNFMPTGNMLIGADHEVESVLADITTADRLAVFTDPNFNAGHSLALVWDNKNPRLECFDIGKVTEKDLEVLK